MASPVYLFTGFLDSGKTTLIRDTLQDPDFMDGAGRTLIISFEDGETELGEKFLKEHNSVLVQMDDVNEFDLKKIRGLNSKYHPSQVFIEYNGSQAVTQFLLQGMPESWPLFEILTTVDAETFENYIANMRSIMFEQLRHSDVIIVNRCTPDTNARALRNNLKAINKRASIYYEGKFGRQVQFKGSMLPYDMNAEVLDIKDDDYGIWYMDCLEDPLKYKDKRIVIRGQFRKKVQGHKDALVMGRDAMVCCAADTSLCGVTVTGITDWSRLRFGDWIEVEGVMKVATIMGEKSLVLEQTSIVPYPPMADPFVYFS